MELLITIIIGCCVSYMRKALIVGYHKAIIGIRFSPYILIDYYSKTFFLSHTQTNFYFNTFLLFPLALPGSMQSAVRSLLDDKSYVETVREVM